MSGKRKQRKGEAAHSQGERGPESQRIRRAKTLRDLPPPEPLDERATNPVILLERPRTLLPAAPAGVDVDVDVEMTADEGSLARLAEVARRSAPPPHLLAPVKVLEPRDAPAYRVLPAYGPAPAPRELHDLEPQPRPTASARPSRPPSQRPQLSTVPPVARTTAPPRRADGGSGRVRALGTVALSACVGAVVALAAWNVQRGFDRATAGEPPGPTALGAAVAAPSEAERCPGQPATGAAVSKEGGAGLSATTASTGLSSLGASPSLAASAAPAEAALHVTLEALPVAQSFGATRSARSRDNAVASVQHAVTRSVETRAPSPRTPETRAPAPRTPRSPRAMVTEAVQRASFAAQSCESGPQSGRIEVTFAPSGAVQAVSLIRGFDSAAVNGCVLRAFGRTRVSPFEGEPIVVRKTVSW